MLWSRREKEKAPIKPQVEHRRNRIESESHCTGIRVPDLHSAAQRQPLTKQGLQLFFDAHNKLAEQCNLRFQLQHLLSQLFIFLAQ